MDLNGIELSRVGFNGVESNGIPVVALCASCSSARHYSRNDTDSSSGTQSRNTDNLQFIKVSKVKVGLDRHIPMEIKSVLHIKAVQWKQPAKQPAK